MNRKVLVVSLDLNNGSNRGIYQYSKALVKAISNQYSTGLLTQALKSDEMEIRESLSDYNQYFYEKYKRIDRYGYYLKKLFNKNNEQKIVKNSKEYLVDNYSNGIDFFLNDPVVYYYNNILLHKNARSCVRGIGLEGLASDDVVVTTSPLNIKSKSNKVIQTLHDVIPLLDSTYFQSDFKKKVYALNYADKILAMSDYTKKSFLNYYPKLEEKIEIVYQSISIDKELIEKSMDPMLNDLVLKKYNLEPNKYMFFIGQIEYRKNIHNLVEAYKIATNGDVERKLILAGNIDYKYIAKYNLLEHFNGNIKDNIEFIGKINDIEKICLIRNSYAFLFPSLSEGFGIPVIEAQTLGVPVLTSNNSSLTEVAGDSAFLVENPEDLEELADGIRQLWGDDELCSNLCKKGFENIKRFSFDTFSDNLNRIIDSV